MYCREAAAHRGEREAGRLISARRCSSPAAARRFPARACLSLYLRRSCARARPAVSSSRVFGQACVPQTLTSLTAITKRFVFPPLASITHDSFSCISSSQCPILLLFAPVFVHAAQRLDFVFLNKLLLSLTHGGKIYGKNYRMFL